MSNRSSLTTPSTNSGSIGQTISASQAPASNVALPDGQFIPVVVLGGLTKGLWSIAVANKVYIPLGTLMVSYNTYIWVNGINYNINENYAWSGATTSATIYEEKTSTIVLNITTDNTTVISYLNGNYTAGAGGNLQSVPVDGSSGSIYCVKLA